jgi:hypothetical protein
MRSASALVLGSLLALASIGCQSKEEMAYKPTAASTASKPQLPEVPTIPTNFKAGDAYTVYGVTHHLNSRIHNKDVTGKEITVVGTIVAENVSTADACGWHKTGKKDPDDCKTEVPTFVIADDATDVKKPRIKVMGWASNFANVFEAFNAYKGKKEAPKELVMDELSGKPIPFPLPAVGARVKVTGTYDYTFSTSTDVQSDVNGILTYSKLEVLEAAPAEVEAPKPASKKK